MPWIKEGIATTPKDGIINIQVKQVEMPWIKEGIATILTPLLEDDDLKLKCPE